MSKILFDCTEQVFDILDPRNPLSINNGPHNLHSGENFWGSTYSENLVFLLVIGANRQGVVSTPWPSAL